MSLAPLILDCTASFRTMWLNKQNPNTIYTDIRSNQQLNNDWDAKERQYRTKKNKKGIPKRVTKKAAAYTLKYKLTLQSDFCHLPFRDEVFSHVCFDPPHRFNMGQTSIYYKLYGCLQKDVWRHSLRTAFKECLRVLKTGGTLNFKWNDRDIKNSELLKILQLQPDYGQRSVHGNRSSTYWFTFIKTSAEGAV